MATECRELDCPTLIDLFKHWDTRVSHQELLFVPLSAAAFPAVAATWDSITPLAVFVVATSSLTVYVYHLFAIRRLAMFQDAIFKKLELNFSDFGELIQSHDRLGVRRLRVLGLPVLAILWVALVLARLDVPFQTIDGLWWTAVTVLFLVSLAVTASVW